MSRSLRRRPSARLLAGPLGLGCVLAVQVAIQAIFGARSFFVGDDFIWLVDAHDMPLVESLEAPVFNSFVPGFRALYKPIALWLGAAYWPVLVFELALSALIGYQIWRIARLCVGDSPWNVVVVFVGGTSALWIPTMIWPADALHVLPNVSASLLALEGFLRHATTGSRAWLLASVAGFAVALAFSSKAFALLLLFAGVRVLLLARTRREILDGAWVYALYALPALLYLAQVKYGGPYYGRGQGAPPVQWGDFPHLLGVMWGSTVVPGWLGIGDLQPRYGLVESDPPVPPTDAWVFVVGQGLVVAAIAWSIARRRAAWRPWVLFGAVFLVHALLLLYGREAQFGLLVGRQYRYIVDFVPLLGLMLLLAFLPSRLAAGHPLAAEASGPTLSRRTRLALLTALAVALPLHLGLSIAGAIDIDRQWPGDHTRDYVHRFEDSYAELRARGEPFHILDGQVPQPVVDGLFIRESRASVLLKLYEPGAPFSDSGPGQAYVIDEQGSLVPGRLALEGSAVLSRARIDAGRVSPRDGAVCAEPAAGARRELRIAVTPEIGSGDHVVMLDYDASAAIDLELSLIRTSGEEVSAFGIFGNAVHLEPGTRARFSASTGRFDVGGLKLALDPGERLCLRRIELRLPVAGR